MSYTANEIVCDMPACIMCGMCRDACYAEAITQAGKEIDAVSMVSLLERDAQVFGRAYGVTFSGGEPLLQHIYLKEVLVRLKQCRIHTAIDTAGCVPWEYFEEVLPYVNTFLYDVKGIDLNTHIKYTSAENILILANLRRLTEVRGMDVWIRVPLISGINDKYEDIQRLGEFLAGLSGFARLDLLPYHNYGIYKARSIGIQEYEFEMPSEKSLRRIQLQLRQMGLDSNIL